jgi:hypothetical protein
MKKMFLLFMVFISMNAFSQGLTGVKIIDDSELTKSYQINDFVNQLKFLKQTVEEVRLATDTLNTQMRAIESLSQGDLDGFLDYFEYQSRAIGQFSDLVDNMDYLEEIDSLKVLLDSDDFNAFKVNLDSLKKSMRSSNNFLRKTNSLVKNAQERSQRQEKIFQDAGKKDSITGQLQLQSESLSLLSGNIQDLIISSTALNNALVTWQEAAEINEKIRQEMAEEVFYGDDDSVYESEYDDELDNAMFGRLDK